MLLGLMCYGMGFLVWLIVLAKAEVSYAYPMISLGYVFTAVLAWQLFGESVTLTRMAGIFITCLGVFIIARSISVHIYFPCKQILGVLYGEALPGQ